jgi:hypothetical protein
MRPDLKKMYHRFTSVNIAPASVPGRGLVAKKTALQSKRRCNARKDGERGVLSRPSTCTHAVFKRI